MVMIMLMVWFYDGPFIQGHPTHNTPGVSGLLLSRAEIECAKGGATLCGGMKKLQR